MRTLMSWLGPIIMGMGIGDWLRTGLNTGHWFNIEFPLILIGAGLVVYVVSRRLPHRTR